MSSFLNERFGEIDLNNKPKYFHFGENRKEYLAKTFLIRAIFFLFFENNNKSFKPFIAGLIF